MATTSGRDRSRASGAGLTALIALLVLAALFFISVNPIAARSAVEPGPASPASQADPSAPPALAAPDDRFPATTPAPPAAPATASPAPRAAPCPPSGLRIPALGVDAPVVQVGLDAHGNLGTPSDADKKKAGWFPNTVLAGSPAGSILMDGHTYHDNSAIFRTDFDDRARVGMSLQLSCAAGESFGYRVSEVRLDLDVADYSSFVDGRRLYASDGPAQVVLVTCTDWNALRREYEHRAILIATPVG